MLLVAPVQKHIRTRPEIEKKEADMIKIVNQKRSIIRAVTNVDYSARVQTVTSDENSFYDIIKECDKLTGCPVLIKNLL